MASLPPSSFPPSSVSSLTAIHVSQVFPAPETPAVSVVRNPPTSPIPASPHTTILHEPQNDMVIADINPISTGGETLDSSEPSSLSYMSDPSAPYLHLKVARARRAVLRAQLCLATCQISEHVSRTRLNRLKVRHFRRAIEEANSDVGKWSDMIRHSGQPLHSSPVVPQHRRYDHDTDLRQRAVYDDEFFVDLR